MSRVVRYKCKKRVGGLGSLQFAKRVFFFFFVANCERQDEDIRFNRGRISTLKVMCFFFVKKKRLLKDIITCMVGLVCSEGTLCREGKNGLKV